MMQWTPYYKTLGELQSFYRESHSTAVCVLISVLLRCLTGAGAFVGFNRKPSCVSSPIRWISHSTWPGFSRSGVSSTSKFGCCGVMEAHWGLGWATQLGRAAAMMVWGRGWPEQCLNEEWVILYYWHHMESRKAVGSWLGFTTTVILAAKVELTALK